MKISFKHYKSFLNETSINLGKFNVIIGENSSGKTSIAEIISHYVDFITNNSPDLKKPNFSLKGLVTIPSALKRKSVITSFKSEKKKNQRSGGDDLHKAKSPTMPTNHSPVFPKYYEMSTLKFLKKDSKYINSQKYLAGFKNIKFATDHIPGEIYLYDKLLCGVRRNTARTRYLAELGRGRAFSSSNYIFSRKRIPRIQEMYNDIYINKKTDKILDNFSEAMDSFVQKLENHPEKRGSITEHDISIAISRYWIEHSIKSAEPFLDGLTLVKDKNSDESFLYNKDESSVCKLMNTTIDNLTESVFKTHIDSVEEKFSDYKKSYKKLYPTEIMPNYPLTMPLKINQSKYVLGDVEALYATLFTGSMLDNSIISLTERNHNLWNKSPYISALHYKMSFQSPSLRSRRSAFNLSFQKMLPNEHDFRQISRYSMRQGLAHQAYLDYSKKPINHFEFKQSPSFQSEQYMLHPFTDFDFYKDFSLKKRTNTTPKNAYKKLNYNFKGKNGNRAIQPAYGPFFSIEDPVLRKGQETVDDMVYDVVKRDVISDIKDIKSFLHEVGAKSILSDFTVVKERQKSGRVAYFKFNPRILTASNSSYLIKDIKQFKRSTDSNPSNCILNLSLYADHFRECLEKSSLLEETIKSKSEIQTVAKKYGVTKDVIYNQIEIIRMYLLRSSIVQFQMNAHRWLNISYSKALRDNLISSYMLNTVENRSGARLMNRTVKSDVTVISPSDGDSFVDKNDLRVTRYELIKYFGKDFDNVLQKEHKGYKSIDNLKKFKRFVNKSLQDIDAEFRIELLQETYSDNSSAKDIYKFGFLSNGASTLLPISNVGMGNISLVSIIGALYKFRQLPLQSKPIVVMREPETYLHPSLIDKLVKFLYKFGNDSKRKNLIFIFETHNESVLRSMQLIIKMSSDDNKKDLFKVYFVKNEKNSGSSIIDLGIKENGFLSKKIDSGFFAVNSRLIKDLWKVDDE